MKISVVQLDIDWGNPRENIRRAEALIDGQNADLYVLPEMWSTGYAVDPKEVAESEKASSALQWMQHIAAERACAVCGSLAIVDESLHYFNRHYFVTGESVKFYDKHHLFSFAHEDKNYQAGNDHVIVEYKGVRFLLLTCYDLRFPLWSRYGHAGEYDAIIYVANWPEARQDAWDTLLRARAIENQCYVIGVNRVGVERKTTFTGGSAVIDPTGRILVSCESRAGSCQTLLDIDVIREVRQRFPVLNDRD